MAEQAEKQRTREEEDALEARRARWVAAVKGRTLEVNEAGWYQARLHGELILMRKDLEVLLDALEAPRGG